jgi:hypothetical protein
VYAAAHVVLEPGYARVDHRVDRPGTGAEILAHIDWDGTTRLRRELADRGFAIAEAMDTAQRFSLGWPAARRLIEACGALQLATGFVAGAAVDHLPQVPDVETLVAGMAYQAEVIQQAGGEVILLPMPQLVDWGLGPADYVAVYRSILERIDGPVYVHWLGEMFLPSLAGYFPGDSFRAVMDLDPGKVRGAKLSLLDADREVELRRHLAANDQVMLTGDDFNFAGLIAGTGDDGVGFAPVTGSTRIGDRQVPTGEFSHALLGIFDGISRPASLALRLLAHGRHADYLRVMSATQELSRVVFRAPTAFYKSGLAFLAWLDGRQDNCMLVNHEELLRDAAYYVAVAELASAAGVLTDAALAARRLGDWLTGLRG